MSHLQGDHGISRRRCEGLQNSRNLRVDPGRCRLRWQLRNMRCCDGLGRWLSVAPHSRFRCVTSRTALCGTKWHNTNQDLLCSITGDERYPTLALQRCTFVFSCEMAPIRVLVTGGAGFVGSHICNRLVNEDDGTKFHVICEQTPLFTPTTKHARTCR